MLKFLREVDAPALFDETDDICDTHTSPEWAVAREGYGKAGFDVMSACAELSCLVAQGRAVLARRDAAQLAYENASEEERAAVDKVDAWVGLLHAGTRHALARGVAGAPAFARLFKLGDVPTDGYRDSVADLNTLLVSLRKLDTTAIKLPGDFTGQGEELVAKLRTERQEASVARGARMMATIELHDLLGRIVEKLEAFATAREFAGQLVGQELPGFDLTFARGALAGHAPAATASPLPVT